MSATESTRRRNVSGQATEPKRDVPVTKREKEDGREPTARSAASPARPLIRRDLIAVCICLLLLAAWNVRRCLRLIQSTFHLTPILQLWPTQPTTPKQWQPKPALHFGEPGTIKIEADTEKQAAIVTVFKVK